MVYLQFNFSNLTKNYVVKYDFNIFRPSEPFHEKQIIPSSRIEKYFRRLLELFSYPFSFHFYLPRTSVKKFYSALFIKRLSFPSDLLTSHRTYILKLLRNDTAFVCKANIVLASDVAIVNRFNFPLSKRDLFSPHN